MLHIPKKEFTKKTLCMYTEVEVVIGFDGNPISERIATMRSWVKDLKKKEKKVRKVEIEMLDEEEM